MEITGKVRCVFSSFGFGNVPHALKPFGIGHAHGTLKRPKRHEQAKLFIDPVRPRQHLAIVGEVILVPVVAVPLFDGVPAVPVFTVLILIVPRTAAFKPIPNIGVRYK